METRCHNCKHRHDPDRLARCLKCHRADDESYHGDVTHLNGRDIPYRKPAGPRYILGDALHDVEDRVRESLCAFFGLGELELLLVRHLVLGGRLATFGSSLASVARRLLLYRGGDRAQAHAMKEQLGVKLPVLASALGVRRAVERPVADARLGVEDRVRAFTHDVLASLNAVELLLVHHAMRRVPLAQFRATTNRVHGLAVRYRAFEADEASKLRARVQGALPSIRHVLGDADHAKLVDGLGRFDRADLEVAECALA